MYFILCIVLLKSLEILLCKSAIWSAYIAIKLNAKASRINIFVTRTYIHIINVIQCILSTIFMIQEIFLSYWKNHFEVRALESCNTVNIIERIKIKIRWFQEMSAWSVCQQEMYGGFADKKCLGCVPRNVWGVCRQEMSGVWADEKCLGCAPTRNVLGVCLFQSTDPLLPTQ